MSKSAIGSLEALVRQLHAERQGHFDAIAEIDAAFQSLGMTATAPKKRWGRPGRPKGSGTKVGTKGAGKRTKRRKFATTANELVLGAIKKAGAKGATGAELTKAWKAAKRPGDAYNTLTMLTKAKQIKPVKVRGERGSRYLVA